MEPTPQGGGIAVVGSALCVAALGWLCLPLDPSSWEALGLVGAAVVIVASVGFVDDIWPLPPLPRLLLQLLAAAVMVVALPADVRALPVLPIGAERALLVFGAAWFVNLTNFMDGMDWMSVIEFVPITAALTLFWSWGFLSPAAGLVALALLGGLIGFAPSNRPVARLFLGDVGSLPIGLMVAYSLIDLAAHGGLAAAILLPLYYIADSGITLIWRLRRGDRIWQAHRLHFYQVAVARGYRVKDVLVRVLVANLALALFAAASLLQPDSTLVAADCALGLLVVGKLLRALSAGQPANDP